MRVMRSGKMTAQTAVGTIDSVCCLPRQEARPPLRKLGPTEVNQKGILL
jgi:hypothetical protein